MNKAFFKGSFVHSIFGEFMLVMTIILVSMGVLIAYYIFEHVDEMVETQYEQGLHELVSEKVSTINEYIDQHLKAVETLSHIRLTGRAMVALQQVFHESSVNTLAYEKMDQRYSSYFTDFLEQEGYYDLFLIDTQGNIVYTIKHESDFSTNLQTGPYKSTALAKVFKTALHNLQASNSSFEYYQPSKEAAAFLAAPIIENKHILGVVALQFNSQRFYDVVNNYTGLGETGEVVVGKKQGDHILITAPLRHDANASFQRTVALNAYNARPIREASVGKTGVAKLDDWRGQEVLAAWQYIPALQWGMVVKIDTAEAFLHWHALRKSLMLYSFLALILTYIFLFFATQRITRPLRKLTQASRDIASGNDDVVLPRLHGKGNEVEVLVGAFSAMLQKLKLSKKSLQDTANALVQSNRVLDERVRDQTTRIRAVLDFTTDGIMTMNADGIIERVNPAACKIFAYTEEELLGQPFTVLMSEKKRAEYTKLLTKAKTVHGMMNMSRELDGRKQSGTLFPIEFRINDMQLGEQYLFLVTVRDITERTEFEYQQARLMEAMNQAQDAVLITDANAVIEYVNPAYQRLSGFSEVELLGATPRLVNSGKMPKSFYKKMWEKLLCGEQWQGEFINQRKNGELYEVAQSISPMLDSNEDIIGFTSVQNDITAEKEEREKLEHTQRLESLGVLAGGIAHDFNNILTAIMGNAALAKLQVDHVSPVTPLLSNIEKASDRAAALCKQMLAYSGKGKFIIEAVNLTHLVREMVNLLEVSIDKNVVMRLDLSEQLLPIEADIAQMQQVIMNLVINASEAIDKYSGTLTIYTGVVDIDEAYIQTTYIGSNLTAGRYVSLEVSDTGCGMDAETKKRLFDPFFTTKFTGRGLGMSAILGIVRGHHGGMKVYSELGKGTTFKLLFPCSDALEAQASVKPKLVPQKQGQGTILIIDDEETIRATASMMLESFGFSVLTAEDGEVGTEVFRNHQHEVCAVLLDMTMPKMDGEACYRALRAINPDVIVILSSGYNEQDATNRFTGKGLAGFIQKPYLPDALRDMVFKALDK